MLYSVNQKVKADAIPEKPSSFVDETKEQSIKNNQQIKSEKLLPKPKIKAIDAVNATNKQELVGKILNSVKNFETVKGWLTVRYMNNKELNYDSMFEIQTNSVIRVIEVTDFEATGRDIPATIALNNGKSTIFGEQESKTKEIKIMNEYPLDQGMTQGMRQMIDGPSLRMEDMIQINDRNEKMYKGHPVQFGNTYSQKLIYSDFLALGLLEDTNLWNITNSNDNNMLIEGTLTTEYSKKMKAETFSLLVDSRTGVLLSVKGFDDKNAAVFDFEMKKIAYDMTFKESNFSLENIENVFSLKEGES
ncbi:hypothetical protein RV11_GL003141 [Enterococcus phoeniculicola]|nr:hypothetical protein RV11_GL003141 [Enterococcus phoeniculicola]